MNTSTPACTVSAISSGFTVTVHLIGFRAALLRLRLGSQVYGDSAFNWLSSRVAETAVRLPGCRNDIPTMTTLDRTPPGQQPVALKCAAVTAPARFTLRFSPR